MLLLLLPCCAPGQTLFTKVTDPNNPPVVFVNTAAPYKGIAWVDLDDDNRPDLFVNQQFLFHNDGNGQFTQLPHLAGAGAGQIASGSSWGDLNNDGHPDCITTSVVSGLHLNNGDNTFTLQTASLPGFTDYSGWDCALADADNNGRLDALFVHANNFHPTGPFSSRLYLQDSGGVFSAVTGYEFTDQLAPYTIPIWADYDLDGDMDLFIGAGPAGTPGPDFCYKNLLKENGIFSLQRLTAAPFNALQDGQTYNFPDVDNDGDLDICLTNYAGAPNRFYRNNGNGTYSSATTPFTKTNNHLANVWGDVDNDGDLDVLVTSDGTTAVQLFRNTGNGIFEAGKTAGTVTGSASGIAMADYDNDGDLDFYTNGANTARALFRNDSLAGNRQWIQLSLQGVQSNYSAIGATVRVKTTLNGQPVWQIRQVQAHNSFQSQNDLRVHFGLSDALTADSVEIRWPSGLKEVFTGLVSGNFYKAVEGQGIGILEAATPLAAPTPFQIAPNPAGQEFRIILPENSPGVESILVFDTAGRVCPVSKWAVGNEWALRFDNRHAPAGKYYVRVVLDGHRVALGVLVKY